MEEIYLKMDIESLNKEGVKKVKKAIDELMKRYPNIRKYPNQDEVCEEIEKAIREAVINALTEQYREVE
jgi:predicted HTH transcriptional regulator